MFLHNVCMTKVLYRWEMFGVQCSAVVWLCEESRCAPNRSGHAQAVTRR